MQYDFNKKWNISCEHQEINLTTGKELAGRLCKSNATEEYGSLLLHIF